MKSGVAGTSRGGLGEWLVLRLSAVYMGGFAIFTAAYFTRYPVRDYQAWMHWFASGYTRLALAVFFLSLIAHAWIGMRSVYMDYLEPFWVRFTVMVMTLLGLLALGIWVARLLLQVESR